MNFLKKLQNKPKYIRIQILWISAILVMIIISLFWLSSLERNLSNSKPKIANQEANTLSVFTIIKEDISLFAKKLKAQISKFKQGQPEFEVEIIK